MAAETTGLARLCSDLSSNRYPEISKQVLVFCANYGLPYNCASLARQFATALQRLVKLGLPTRQQLRSGLAAMG